MVAEALSVSLGTSRSVAYIEQYGSSMARKREMFFIDLPKRFNGMMREVY